MRSIEFAIIQGSRQTAAWSWWFDAACGGGMAGAVLSHVTDALCFMLDACARLPLSQQLLCISDRAFGLSEMHWSDLLRLAGSSKSAILRSCRAGEFCSL